MLSWIYSIIQTITKWFFTQVPAPVQWLVMIIPALAAIWGITMNILKRIYGKPHLTFNGRKYGNDTMGFEILNMPIENITDMDNNSAKLVRRAHAGGKFRMTEVKVRPRAYVST